MRNWWTRCVDIVEPVKVSSEADGILKSLPHREDVSRTSKEGAEQAEELSAVALLNWEDQILWGLEWVEIACLHVRRF